MPWIRSCGGPEAGGLESDVVLGAKEPLLDEWQNT